jgi:hypothetical protein
MFDTAPRLRPDRRMEVRSWRGMMGVRHRERRGNVRPGRYYDVVNIEALRSFGKPRAVIGWRGLWDRVKGA